MNSCIKVSNVELFLTENGAFCFPNSDKEQRKVWEYSIFGERVNTTTTELRPGTFVNRQICTATKTQDENLCEKKIPQSGFVNDLISHDTHLKDLLGNGSKYSLTVLSSKQGEEALHFFQEAATIAKADLLQRKYQPRQNPYVTGKQVKIGYFYKVEQPKRGQRIDPNPKTVREHQFINSSEVETIRYLRDLHLAYRKLNPSHSTQKVVLWALRYLMALIEGEKWTEAEPAAAELLVLWDNLPSSPFKQEREFQFYASRGFVLDKKGKKSECITAFYYAILAAKVMNHAEGIMTTHDKMQEIDPTLTQLWWWQRRTVTSYVNEIRSERTVEALIGIAEILVDGHCIIV